MDDEDEEADEDSEVEEVVLVEACDGAEGRRGDIVADAGDDLGEEDEEPPNEENQLLNLLPGEVVAGVVVLADERDWVRVESIIDGE